REVYEWLSSHLERPLPPPGKVETEKKRGESNKRVSNKKLRSIGWEPYYSSFRRAMSESILPSFGFDR
ncbi:MAG: hypothetical protein QOE34_2055, partial [Verrucomicrobiota bacterium]